MKSVPINIPHKLIELSRLDDATTPDRVIKMQEELGEVAVAVLKFRGRKWTSLTREEAQDQVIEETVDLLITAMDLLVDFDFTDPIELDKLIKKKLAKWEATLENERAATVDRTIEVRAKD